MDDARHSIATDAFPVETLRAEFPALALERDGRPAVYLDGPGGTQVPQRVIDAVSGYFVDSNANHGGAFETSVRSDAIAAEAHAAVADLLGATAADEIHFGPNMTTLTFHVSRSIGAMLEPGDEIVVTTLDHEANRGPWQAVAAERGLVVRTVDVREADVTLDLDAFEAVLGPRTRLVALGYASNAVGSVNPVTALVERAHAAGALTYIDAVHYAPHGSIDVVALGTDFLACSVYKWFGPHQGVLYVRSELVDSLPRYKLRPASDPIETGTQSFESMAGTLAATEYLRAVGRSVGGESSGGRRAELMAAMSAIGAHEREIGWRLLDGLLRIPGIRIWGITERDRLAERTPTFAITIEGLPPSIAATELGRAGIFTWDGDFYATGLIERLGLLDGGGVLRLGLVHYNTAAEVDRTLGELERLAVVGARRG
jgi:cysteine desulfurase family protein (TIGR01976 family)